LRRVMKFAPVLLAGVLVMSACGGDDDDAGGGATSPAATTSSLKVGLAYDIGGRGDQSFNDSAARGLDQAKTDFGIAEDNVNELEASAGETDAQKEERLRQLAEGGYNPIIAVGFAYSGPLGTVAKDFPDTNFAIIDDAGNLMCEVGDDRLRRPRGSDRPNCLQIGQARGSPHPPPSEARAR